MYQTFHTGNAEHVVTAAELLLRQRVDQQHTFRFADLTHLADTRRPAPSTGCLPS